MHTRKSKRISTEGMGITGDFILHPDPNPIQTELIDISEGGAGVRLVGTVSKEQKQMLDMLVRNAQAGKRTPVAFSISDTKIPIVIVNNWNDDCFGFLVSESGHQKLAALAERGRSLFQALTEEAVGKGAKHSDYKEYPVLSMEYLPPDIQEFVKGREFIALFMPQLATTIVENIPSIKKSISTPQDIQHLQGVLFRFLKAQGKDIRLIMGAALHFLLLKEPETPLEKLVGPATTHLFDDDRLVGFEEQARLRDLFMEDVAARQRTAEAKVAADVKPTSDTASPDTGAAVVSFKAIPDNHPLAGIIKTRFDAFSRKIFFIQKLAPTTTDHYFNKFIPRDHEMIEIAKEDPRLQKTLLPRWVQNELQEISNSKDHRIQGLVEDYFRLAMFEYMMGRRAQSISHEEIHDLFEGKMPAQYVGVRDKFLTSVCDLIHPGIMQRFGDFKTDTDFERSKKLAERDNETRIGRLCPDDLTKEFLWPKVVEMGEIFPLQREFAKAWVADEKQLISISDLGGVVVIPYETFAEFAKMVDRYSSEGAKASDFFVKVDLGAMYRRTVKMKDGTEAKDVFGLYVDTLKPEVAREKCYDKVVNNPANCVYYVLNKSKLYLTKVFGKGAHEAINLINRGMLTIQQEAKEFI